MDCIRRRSFFCESKNRLHDQPPVNAGVAAKSHSFKSASGLKCLLPVLMELANNRGSTVSTDFVAHCCGCAFVGEFCQAYAKTLIRRHGRLDTWAATMRQPCSVLTQVWLWRVTAPLSASRVSWLLIAKSRPNVVIYCPTTIRFISRDGRPRRNAEIDEWPINVPLGPNRSVFSSLQNSESSTSRSFFDSAASYRS